MDWDSAGEDVVAPFERQERRAYETGKERRTLGLSFGCCVWRRQERDVRRASANRYAVNLG